MSISDEMSMYAKAFLDIKKNPKTHKKLNGKQQ
jgi:hypothetical protein